MFGYLFYYDLVADEAEQEYVSRHIRNIIDYIIDGGFVLKDLDGAHTKWGVWSPEILNKDPDWAPERGINFVEILSYLKLAYHSPATLAIRTSTSNCSTSTIIPQM
jgi:hypothetical protein